MQSATKPDKELLDKARRELLAKVYTLILAEDWEDEALESTALMEAAEKPEVVESDEGDVYPHPN